MSEEIRDAIVDLLRSVQLGSDKTVEAQASAAAIERLRVAWERQSRTAGKDVFINVSGGVAYVAEAPDGVEVHIIDYDDLESNFEKSFRQLSPAAQAFCLQAENGIITPPPDYM